MNRKYLIILLFTLIVLSLNAGNVNVQAYVDQTKIGIQDYLKYTIEISGEDIGDVVQPYLESNESFDVKNVFPSTSSQTTIINGRIESKTEKKFTYTISPMKKGNIIIPKVKVIVNGKKYYTKPIQILVVEGSLQSAPPVANQRFSYNNYAGQSGKLKDNLFVETQVSKRNLYKGEVLIVSHVIYSKYDLYNIAPNSDPSYSGFWKETLYSASRLSPRITVRNGVKFYYIVLDKLALSPTETGSLTLPPVEYQVEIEIPSRSFFTQTKNYFIKSKPVKVRVSPLPENAPESFGGAIGRFTFKSDISSTDLKVGDSFTYTLEISGAGNLSKFDVPTLPKVNNIRFLDPEITFEKNEESDDFRGVKTAKYLGIVEEQGDLEIPPVKFTYFSPDLKKYITLESKPYLLNVTAGVTYDYTSGPVKRKISAEGQDIAFIITDSNLKSFKIILSSPYYWLLYAILLFTIPIVIIFASKREELYSNKDLVRSKFAEKILKKYLHKATTFANIGDMKFYAESQIGLKNYITDKLGIPRGSSSEELFSEMAKNSYFQEATDLIKNYFQKCDQARFMPGGFNKQNIKDDYQELKQILKIITKK